MDPVSHVVIGWSVVRAQTKAGPVRGSTLAVVLGALSPDIDLLLMPTGWDRYLVAHEAGTHSLVGATICGALAAGLTQLIYRRAAYRVLLLASSVGAIAHIAGDVLSGATLRLAWPFLDTRISNLGAVAMADPYLISVCSAGMLLAWTVPSQRRGCALALIAGLIVLLSVKTISRERTMAIHATPANAVTIGAAHLVEPIAGWLTKWRVVDRTETAIRVWHVDAASGAQLTLTVPRLPAGVEAAGLANESRNWPTVQNFLRAHDFTFAAFTRSMDGTATVLWSDGRYCRATTEPDSIECDVWAGGIADTSGRLMRLVVRVGSVVHTR